MPVMMAPDDCLPEALMTDIAIAWVVSKIVKMMRMGQATRIIPATSGRSVYILTNASSANHRIKACRTVMSMAMYMQIL